VLLRRILSSAVNHSLRRAAKAIGQRAAEANSGVGEFADQQHVEL
jgi:hypothetical protein